MALRGWQRATAQNAFQQMQAANQRRYDLLNPRLPQLPAQAASGLSSLVSSYNQAYEQARAANEERYQQLLDIADQTTQQRAADIRSAYGRQSSDIMQQLARTGLANTTVAPTLQMGVQREQQSALNRLADTMQQTKLGIIERRTDAYPDRGALSQTIQSLGAGFDPGSIFATLGRLRF